MQTAYLYSHVFENTIFISEMLIITVKVTAIDSKKTRTDAQQQRGPVIVEIPSDLIIIIIIIKNNNKNNNNDNNDNNNNITK